MRRQHRQAAQALDPSEAGSAHDQLQPIEQSGHPRKAAVQLQAHDPPEPAHLARRDRVVRMRFEPRVEHPCHARIGLETPRHRERVGVVPVDADRQRLEAASQGVGGLWVEHGAHESARPPYPLEQGRATGQRASRDVMMAVQILRRAVHAQVDAQGDRRLIEWARERAVDDRRDTSRPARRRDGRDVQTSQRRVDRRLEPDDAGAIAEDIGGCRQLLEADEARAHVEG